MRKFLKFLHTLGAIGLIGAMASMVVLLAYLPDTTSVDSYARMRAAVGGIAEWLVLPSLGVVLVSGLLAMANGKAFYSAGWVLVKLALGILMFKGTLFGIQGPAQAEAVLAAQVLGGNADPQMLGDAVAGEQAYLWIMLALSGINVLLAIWRPKLSRKAQPGPLAESPGNEHSRTIGAEPR